MIISGCATGTVFTEYESSIPELSTENGRIYVYRKTTFGAAIQPSVKLDGEIIGTAKPKGFFFIDKPAGSYQISTATEAKRNLNVELSPGEQKYVRLEVRMGFLVGHIKPILVDVEVGEEEILKMKYIG